MFKTILRYRVLIVPCGMETYVGSGKYNITRVLIVPCGMETPHDNASHIAIK